MPNNPFIIGEIGINASGDILNAKKLIIMAKDAGCDAVKFQKRDINTVYTKEFLLEKRESPWGVTQYDQKIGLEFNEEEYWEIDRCCHNVGIEWFASAWDCKSQKFLRQLKMPYNKIASAMLTNKPLVGMILEDRKHTFISTGMSTWEQIGSVVQQFEDCKVPYTLMHCVSVYPCEDEDCNIWMIRSLRNRYGDDNVGYSGHEKGILPSVLAVAHGAVAIERHITLDRTSYGSDQSASLEPKGLELLVRDCRDIAKMMGSGKKVILPKEKDCAKKLRWHEA